jgi:Holliday junction DNA helicase RuvA
MGPKVASGMFATGSINGIVDAINKENILYLTKFPKIGDKLARQIVLDLKGKLFIETSDINDNSVDELISVLENLGYKSAEIKKVVGQIDSSLPLEEQVKEALKLLLK